MKYRIVNLQACDLYQVIDGEMVSSGLSLKHTNKDGEIKNSRWLYTAMFNESMLCDKFEKIVERGDVVKKSDAIFPKANKNTTTLYTNQIIQLKFEYSVKEETLEEKKLRKKDKDIKAPKTFMARKELREYVYENGFDIDGIHYVRWMRSGGSARVGKCLFINEKLKHSMDLDSDAKVNLAGKVDLASYEAYRSLMLSTKIDSIVIKPENILLVKDYDSVFTDKCNVTKVRRTLLTTVTQNVKVSNSIWDGQSLIDKSLMGDYADKGMILLRNVMFKSCCFNANIQDWFRDNGITEISQLNGQTVAKDIKDIKLITTPSSIKYKKFGKEEWFKDWLKLAKNEYGIVKYEKPPKHQKQTMVSTHYQLINTLDLLPEEIEELIQPSIDRINKVIEDPNEMLDYCSDYVNDESSIQTKKELVYKLLKTNMDISQTSFYANLVKKVKEEMRGDIKQGRILVNGNYSTLCGNPVEMLQHAIGKFKGRSVIGKGNVVSKRFEEEELLICRSPHITMGNIYVANNKKNKLVDKYLNFTNEIIGINSIKENTLQRLQGCDFDSDTALITNNSILIEAAKKNYDKFTVPFNAVESENNPKEYTMKNLAELDHETSVNLIGEIVNLSQLLNSIYWHSERLEYSNDDLKTGYMELLYKDICTLSVLSGIEIDKAKKVFNIDSAEVLDKIRRKYSYFKFPRFFSYIDQLKGTKKKKIESKRLKDGSYMKYNCSMDLLYDQIVNKKLSTYKADGDIIKVIMTYNDKRRIDEEQAGMIIDACVDRLKANEAISKENGEAKIQMKYVKDLDLYEAIEGALNIPNKKLSINTIRYCVAQFNEMEKGNSLTEYMLLGLLNCRENKAISALSKRK